jgi:hypothetical protein
MDMASPGLLFPALKSPEILHQGNQYIQQQNFNQPATFLRITL